MDHEFDAEGIRPTNDKTENALAPLNVHILGIYRQLIHYYDNLLTALPQHHFHIHNFLC